MRLFINLLPGKPLLLLLALLLAQSAAAAPPADNPATFTLYGQVAAQKKITINKAGQGTDSDPTEQMFAGAAIGTALATFLSEHATDGSIRLHLLTSASPGLTIALRVQDAAGNLFPAASLQGPLPTRTVGDSTLYNLSLSQLSQQVPTGGQLMAVEVQLSLVPDVGWLINGQGFYQLGTLEVGSPLAVAPPAATDPYATATEKEVVDFLSLSGSYPGFHRNQVYRRGTTAYLFVSRDLKLAPGTVWPACNETGTSYQMVVIDRPAEGASGYVLKPLQVDVLRDPELNINNGDGPTLEKRLTTVPEPVGKLAESSAEPHPGTLLITAVLEAQVSKDGASVPEHNQQSFRLPDCNAHFQASILVGLNASFLSNPTNFARVQLPNSSDYTLAADDPTTHESITLMALFYPTPRRYGYQYKDLTFFQKFNVSVGAQIGPTRLGDILVGLNYEVAKGLNFGAGGHYGRHTVLVGYPDFIYGQDVYRGLTFVQANDTRQQWDLAWYVGLGIDLRVIRLLFGNQTVNDLRSSTSLPVAQ